MRLLAASIAGLALAALAGRDAGGIASADLRLSAGHTKTILRIPDIGRWTATCSRGGRVGVTFTADFRLATSDLVVTRTAGAPLARRVDPEETLTPEPPGPVLAQHWQIAPFAAAQVQVTAATVTGRSLGAGEAYACAASVVAITGPDQGATRTG